MSDATHRWADELKESIDVLKTMKDEVKVQMHLANMDAKARVTELERRFENEQLSARKSFKELISGFMEVRDQLKKAPQSEKR